MAVVTEQTAHPELVGAGQTALHSHAGAGGADVKCGSVSLICGTSTPVTFTTPFSSTPEVVVSMGDDVAKIDIPAAHTISTTGFTLYLHKGHTGGAESRVVRWIATDAGNT